MAIRLRLTLLYTLILLISIAVFGGLVYSAQSRDSFRLEQDLLQQASKQLAPTETSITETYVQWLSLDGEILGRSTALGVLTLPLSESGWGAVRDGDPWTETGQLGRRSVLVYSRQVAVPGQPARVLQVARPLSDRSRTLRAMRTEMFLAGGVLTTLAFGLGSFLAQAGLEPLNQVSETAASIGESRDFSRRISYHGAHDELYRLVSTFNGMLADLELAHRRTERALAAQQSFVADASHELRTPLSIIRGNLGLLKRTPPITREDATLLLNDAVYETERLGRLVDHLLTLARLDAGQRLNTGPVELYPILTERCRQMRRVACDRSIRCVCDPDLVALGDRDAVNEILTILIDNAIIHTPPDAAITVQARREANQALVEVIDAGPGIEPQVLERLFDRFYRVDVARSDGGTGLGLAIAKALADAQGAAISAASQLGQGSVFTVVLPAV